jgi:L-methionine (R)-S-oxide reductase
MEQLFSSVLKKFEETETERLPLETLMSKTTLLLKENIPHYDWVGFYILEPETDTLILGPYTGKPTEHTRIPVGKGICGQVAESKKSMIVQDVTEQTNYIACSLYVQSEIVVPILKNGLFVAEIDIDSHAYAPFTEADELFLTAIAEKMSTYF